MYLPESYSLLVFAISNNAPLWRREAAHARTAQNSRALCCFVAPEKRLDFDVTKLPVIFLWVCQPETKRHPSAPVALAN